MDVRELIPKSKHDLERANAAVLLGYPAVKEILPELLEWLQDLNWPVAMTLAPFLFSIGEPIVPFLRPILSSDDEVWKYWIIAELISPSRNLTIALASDLGRIANSPTETEAEAGLDADVKRVFSCHGIDYDIS